MLTVKLLVQGLYASWTLNAVRDPPTVEDERMSYGNENEALVLAAASSPIGGEQSDAERHDPGTSMNATPTLGATELPELSKSPKYAPESPLANLPLGSLWRANTTPSAPPDPGKDTATVKFTRNGRVTLSSTLDQAADFCIAVAEVILRVEEESLTALPTKDHCEKLAPVSLMTGEGHKGAALKPGRVQVDGQGQSMQAAIDVAPVVGLKVPVGQSVQLAAPALEKEPLGQSVALMELKGQ